MTLFARLPSEHQLSCRWRHRLVALYIDCIGVLTTCLGKIKAVCMRSHISGVLPNAFDSLMAISGDIVERPLITLDSVGRVTSNDLGCVRSQRAQDPQYNP